MPNFLSESFCGLGCDSKFLQCRPFLDFCCGHALQCLPFIDFKETARIQTQRAEVASKRAINFASTYLFIFQFPIWPPVFLLAHPAPYLVPLPAPSLAIRLPTCPMPIQLPTWSAAPGLPTWPPVFLLAHPASYLERPVSTSPLCFLHATKHLAWSPTWGHQYPCWGHPSPYLVPRLGSLFRATNLPYLGGHHSP
jgi:hypothetical protein